MAVTTCLRLAGIWGAASLQSVFSWKDSAALSPFCNRISGRTLTTAGSVPTSGVSAGIRRGKEGSF